jgi:hypothetical protein
VELHCFISLVIFRTEHNEGKVEEKKNEWVYKYVSDLIKRAERCYVNKQQRGRENHSAEKDWKFREPTGSLRQ